MTGRGKERPRYVSCVLYIVVSLSQLLNLSIENRPAVNAAGGERSSGRTQNSDPTWMKIPAVYREGVEVACLFHPREPEVLVNQYLADIDGAIVVICS